VISAIRRRANAQEAANFVTMLSVLLWPMMAVTTLFLFHLVGQQFWEDSRPCLQILFYACVLFSL
jgi:hypothetical protein